MKLSIKKSEDFDEEDEKKKNQCKLKFERFKEICANLFVYSLILYFSYEAVALYFVEY